VNLTVVAEIRSVTLDAGRDPEAEMMEHLQQLIVEMEKV